MVGVMDYKRKVKTGKKKTHFPNPAESHVTQTQGQMSRFPSSIFRTLWTLIYFWKQNLPFHYTWVAQQITNMNEHFSNQLKRNFEDQYMCIQHKEG